MSNPSEQTYPARSDASAAAGAGAFETQAAGLCRQRFCMIVVLTIPFRKSAMHARDWLISSDGQKAIADYKVGGEQLFLPDAGAKGM